MVMSSSFIKLLIIINYQTITTKINLKIVNYLDVQLNLNEKTYKPYRKPNNDPICINRLSNHPPTIIKEITKAIRKRISEISSSEKIFREIIWYNPPFSLNLKTNIGKIFFKLLNKHFPVHKIFNKNTVKVKLSCMRNNYIINYIFTQQSLVK